MDKKELYNTDNISIFEDTPDPFEYIVLFLWQPEWHLLKIKSYLDLLENQDLFIKNNTWLDNYVNLENDDEYKSLRNFFIIEIIAGIMIMIECLAALSNAFAESQKDVRGTFLNFKATKFFNEIDKFDIIEYAKILAYPPHGRERDYNIYLAEDLKATKLAFQGIKVFYFRHLDLFNSYKHGFRVFCRPSSPAENNTLAKIGKFTQHGKFNHRIADDRKEPMKLDEYAMYFSNKKPEDGLKFIHLEQDIDKLGEISEALLYMIDIIRGNHIRRFPKPKKSKIETKVAITIPMNQNIKPLINILLSSINDRGVDLMDQGNLEEALKCFEDVIHIDPNWISSWINKGNALARKARYNESLECFDEAICLNSELSSSWINKAIILRIIGKDKDAEIAFKKARELGYTGQFPWKMNFNIRDNFNYGAAPKDLN